MSEKELSGLRRLIKANITNIAKGNLGKKVVRYENANSKYAILKNSVIVKIELIDGISADLDITEYFFDKDGNEVC